MADQVVQVQPDGAGKKVQTFENQVGQNLVEAQAVVQVNAYSGQPSQDEAAIRRIEEANYLLNADRFRQGLAAYTFEHSAMSFEYQPRGQR